MHLLENIELFLVIMDLAAAFSYLALIISLDVVRLVRLFIRILSVRMIMLCRISFSTWDQQVLYMNYLIKVIIISKYIIIIKFNIKY